MSNHTKVTVTVTTRTIVRTILLVIAAILLLRFIGQISHVLTIIFASLFLALAINPVVSWISRRLKIDSRVGATAAAYLLVISAIVGFFILVTPPLVNETRSFVQEVPKTVENFQRGDSSLARLVERYNLNEQLSEAASKVAARYADYGDEFIEAGRRVFTVIVSILAVIVLTFMMLVEGPRWLDSLWRITPDSNRERYQRIARKMYRGVTGFVLGQVIIALVGAFFVFLALMIASSLLDVSINAFALAGIVAVLSLIPLFGTIVAGTIIVVVSALNSMTLGIIMLIYYVVYQQIENHTIQPYVQSRVNQLTPMLVFIAALIGIGFGGLLGALVAIPIAGAIKVLFEDQLEQRGLKPRGAGPKSVKP